MKTIWGIDLGGSKIEGVVLKSDGKLETLKRLRIPTCGDLGYEHILDQIKKLVELLACETSLYPERLGMGIPGCIDKETGLVKNSNSVSLIGKPLESDISSKLGIPVITANDANCFALAETKFGIVSEIKPEAEVVFGVIMGTGVGGGIVVNEKIINGIHGIAGEWGHNFLDNSGGKCYCGRSGCVETLLSGPALEKFYHRISGSYLNMKEISQRKHTDKFARETLQRLIHYFGKAMAMVINILDPDAVILGGGLGNIKALYDDGPAEVQKYLFNKKLNTLFLSPKLGDSAGVFGAAALTANG